MKAREKLKEFGKRTLSCIMALSMCMSFVPDVPVFAESTDTEVTTEVSSYDSTEGTTATTKSQTEEVKSTKTSDDGTYTVTLDSVYGGEICFYTSDTDTTESVTDKRITAGSSVGIKFIPADGYKVSSFTISDADRNELYRDETSDDVFEFTMPEMDVVVGGSFEQTKQSTEASTDTEISTDKTGSDTPGIKLEGNGAKIIGDASGSKPDYLDDMNAYTAKILGTNTTAIAATIKANQNKLNESVMAVGRTDTSGYGVVACADLIDNAYESATGFSINSSLAREVFNKLRENDDNWEIVYKNIAYSDPDLKNVHWCDVFLLVISVLSCIKTLTPLLIVFEIIQIYVIVAVRVCGTASLWNLKWRIITIVCPIMLYFCR